MYKKPFYDKLVLISPPDCNRIPDIAIEMLNKRKI